MNIKFRAWDLVNKRMILEPYIHFIDGESFYLDERNHGGKMRSDLEIKLMQYTGLMDENGVEICTGDIVRFNGFKKDRIELIEWENICKHTSFGGGTHNAVVIGNKYENAELLLTLKTI